MVSRVLSRTHAPREEQEIFKRQTLASVAQVIDPELKTKGRFFSSLACSAMSMSESV